MRHELKLIDDRYREWIVDLGNRYQRSQIKAATSVNHEMLRFYLSLGKDIVDMNAENTYGSGFLNRLSTDLGKMIPSAKCFSVTNLRYMKYY